MLVIVSGTELQYIIALRKWDNYNSSPQIYITWNYSNLCCSHQFYYKWNYPNVYCSHKLCYQWNANCSH